MADAAALWPLIEKGGVAAILAVNSFVLYKAGVVGLTQIMDGKWVPGRYYDEVSQDNDRLRAENNALREVAFRAVRVAERDSGERDEHEPTSNHHHRASDRG